MVSRYYVLLGVTILFALGVPLQAFAETPFWTEHVSWAFTTEEEGKTTSLVFDEFGYPHICWYQLDGNVRILFYAYRKGGLWNREKVIEGTTLGSDCSLALDALGNPHISYYDAGDKDVMYAFKENGMWISETVDDGGGNDVGEFSSLAIDRTSDLVHIIYFDATVGQLKYASGFTFAWTKDIIDRSGDTGEYGSLALDAAGNPHVAYYDKTNGILRYAHMENYSWILDVADDGGGTDDVGSFTSIALDAGGRPHISYYNKTTAELRYARFDGANWTRESVEGGFTGHAYNSIDVHPEEGARIAYEISEGYNRFLRCALRTDSEWILETVDNAASAGGHCSLAMDPYGNPHILYHHSFQSIFFAGSSVQLNSPMGGEVWASESDQDVLWTGLGDVDIQLSVDDGANYSTILSSIRGGRATLQVPAGNTEHAKIKIIRTIPYSSSESPASFKISQDVPPPAPFVLSAASEPYHQKEFCSMALDGSSNPHVCYYDASSKELMRAHWSASDDWSFEVIEDIGALDVSGGVLGTSIALDEQDIPHVVYTLYAPHEGGYYLRYACKKSDSWISEEVENGTHVGMEATIALDGEGNPYLGYYNRDSAKGTWFAYRTEAGWTKEGLNETTAGPSLAVDAGGQIHFVCRDEDRVVYLYKSPGETWITEEVASGVSMTGVAVSLDLDPNGEPHLLYIQPASHNMFYAHKTDGTWLTEPIIDWAARIYDISLAVDADGTPHVGYHDTFLDVLKYAVRTSMGWSVQKVNEVGTGADFVSLELDAYGNPSLCYCDMLHRVVKYAYSGVHLLSPAGRVHWLSGGMAEVRWSGLGEVDILMRNVPPPDRYGTSVGRRHGVGTGWRPGTDEEPPGTPANEFNGYTIVRSSASGGSAVIDVPSWYTNMAVVAIVRWEPYSTSSSGLIVSISPDPPPVRFEKTYVDLSGQVGMQSTLVLDAQDNPHISYYDLGNKDLKYAYMHDGSWIVETVDQEGDVGNSTSIALDSQGDPHICYYDGSNFKLKYAHRTGDEWLTEFVGIEDRVGSFNSLAVDDNDIPHVSYYDFGNQKLLYASRINGFWDIETADDVGPVGTYASLKLDAEGYPHVSYTGSNVAMKYAFKDNEGWHAETVESGGVRYLYAQNLSLALDGTGLPHICFYDSRWRNLEYVQKTDGGWEHIVVASEGNVGTDCSLALDDRDASHISYFNDVNHSLDYAYKLGEVWTVTQIDNSGNIRMYNGSSIAIDSRGGIHVSYYDATRGFLRYARQVN